MNRRSFFARMLGAACLAVAERVLPSSIGAVKPQWSEPTTSYGKSPSRDIGDWLCNLLCNPPYVSGKMMDLSGLRVTPSMLRRDDP